MADSRAALEFLVEASEILGSSLDYELILSSTARLAVAHLADWCAIDIVEDRAIHRVVTARSDAAREELVKELPGFQTPPGDRGGAAEVIRTGRSLLYPEVPAALLEAAAREPERQAMLRELGRWTAPASAARRRRRGNRWSSRPPSWR